VRMRPWWCMLGAAALLGLHARTAAACSATPEPWYTIDRQAPLGDAVPLNAPLVVELLSVASDVGVPGRAPTLSLTVVGADESVTLSPLDGGRGSKLSFVPGAELEPRTTYRARFETGQTALDDTQPQPQPSTATWEFTTGDELAPPFELTGELSVTLEAGQDPVYTCSTPCGDGCVESGKQAVTKARVTVPTLSGGFGARYRATLLLTDDTPGSFAPRAKPDESENLVRVEQYAEIEPGAETDVVVTLPLETMAYRPCFAFKAWDDRGDEVAAEALCLEQAFPPTYEPPQSGASGAGGAGPMYPRQPMGDDTVKPKSKSSGCAVAPGETSAAWLVLLLVAARRSRRRAVDA
jgi:MYXO-CTERM domain-containing protein